MANKKLTRVDINSVNVSAHLVRWNIKENFGNPIYEANLEFSQNINDDVTLTEGQTVEVWEGYTTSTDIKRFKGELIAYDPDGGTVKIKAYNEMYAAVRNTINAKIYDASVVGDPIYPDGKISDCFIDLMTTYSGLNADGTSVQDSGTALVITEFVCDHTDPKERADRLAEAKNWHYFYKASDDKVYFEPKRFSTNSATLTVGDNVIEVPKWKNDKTDLINDLRLDGLFQDKEIKDLFNGDGAEDTFTLSATPVKSMSMYVSASKNYSTDSIAQSELQSLGVTGATTGFDYTIDKSTKEAIFVSGSKPPSGTNNVMAKYVGSIAVPVHLVNDISIDTYKLHARTIQLTDVITVADAEMRVLEVLNRFKTPFRNATLKVKHDSTLSYSVGQEIPVVDSYNKPNIDANFTIYSIIRHYPGGFDEVSVGDRDFEPPEFYINQSERINRLERELISEGLVLTELRPIEMELDMVTDNLVVLLEFANDSFIGNHDVNGIIYDEADVIDDFETEANWTDQGTPTLTITANSTSGQFWIGTQGTKATWPETSGTAIMQNIAISKDISGITGVNSGTPTKGTTGVWAYMTEGSDISNMKLRIGSSASDYMEYNGKQYAWKVAVIDSSFVILDAIRTYILFDLDSPDASSGTPDWTAMDFVQLRWTITGAGDITFDYLTGSPGNIIALNGAGDRSTQLSETTYNY